jgi:hypothetical protein
MCRVVCFPLAGYLNFLGEKCEVVTGEFNGADHSWIRLVDGLILDPTIDQFSGTIKKFPKIYIGRPTEFHRPP